MRILYFIIFSLFTTSLLAQDIRSKKIAVRDSVILDSVSINPFQFEITSISGDVIDSTLYTMDFPRSILSLKAKKEDLPDSLIINYRVYPDFLTNKYRLYDSRIIVNSTGALDKAVSLSTQDRRKPITPFSGLNVSGSILRGVTTGNNQNSTLNSALDLQVSGKLNDRVTLRASIQDANVPSQQGGFSQNLDEFDQIFIELFTDNWNIRAGDINLQNSDSYFGQFTKKIQGLAVKGTLNHSETVKTDLFASGALVRGVFTQSNFVGQEGNQGPYKLTGPNGELFVLVVSGSERVYVNGIPLKRGETEDYVIDYNAGEIQFNATYPITSEMRITIEYQFSERRYTRFLAYGGGTHTRSDNFKISAHVYSESDAKNQPLQQVLSREQIEILQDAGDDETQMIAPSAIEDTFDDNKILYRQIVVDGVQVFEFSTDPDETLFQVRFTDVGQNQGDYILSTTNTLQRTFEYVAPINGVRQGSFAPQVQLFAPTLLQLGVVNGSYTPSEKTNINFELAGSKNDLNTFSDIDDDDNNGYAAHINIEQQLFQKDSTAQLSAFGNWDYIQENFVNIEGLYNVEFNRDWNLENSLANASDNIVSNQSFTTLGARYTNNDKGALTYQFQHLDFKDVYSGRKHNLQGDWKIGKLHTYGTASTLSTNDNVKITSFTRGYTRFHLSLKKGWIGGHAQLEDNLSTIKSNDSITPDSQRFYEYGAYAGVGDSTKVFVEVGYRFRESDSLVTNRISTVNKAHTYYINTQLIKNQKTNLSLYTNFRNLQFTDDSDDENALNSRLLYDQKLANNILRWNTVFETNSGTQAQQEFTFVEVDEGLGTFTWNDYNEDGIQQLEEFEIAQFQDEAEFLRVLLPNQIFVQTHQNRLSQQLTINPSQWSGKKGLKKALSNFHNQTSYIVDRKVLRGSKDFSLNPFNQDDDEIAASISFRNTLFFNRGKQRYTTSYTLLNSDTKNLLSTGLQENKITRHQFNFLHKVKNSWLLTLAGETGSNQNDVENFEQRNFDLNISSTSPRVSYLFGKQSRVALFYEFQHKENTIGSLESLSQNNFGISFALADFEKVSLNGELKYINNDFTGSSFTPVAFQILEGLQPGTNLTWNLIAQKRITKFLDLNVSYFGRSSETTQTIHTGNVQIKAFF